MRLISQSIKGILTVLQKLLQYFNGIAISTIFVLPLTGFFLDIFYLRLKRVSNIYSDIFLNWLNLSSIVKNVQIFVNNCCCILVNYI